MSSELQKLWRPDLMNKMWIMWLTGFIFSFFFTFIYTKGCEGKGIFEGIRYGLYIGLMMVIPMAYNQYAVYPIPYSIAWQWFVFGMVQYILLGITVSLIYRGTPKETK
ncbi:MAG: hypothetical protein QME25_05945 [Bacteroidota bacterium]|nr:hypothetical protein [Bacteroidota bacterium]